LKVRPRCAPHLASAVAVNKNVIMKLAVDVVDLNARRKDITGAMTMV